MFRGIRELRSSAVQNRDGAAVYVRKQQDANKTSLITWRQFRSEKKLRKL